MDTHLRNLHRFTKPLFKSLPIIAPRLNSTFGYLPDIGTMGAAQNQIEFFKAGKFAVVGASADRSKYGNKVFRWYLDHNLSVVPINPKSPTIESHQTHASLSALPSPSEYAVSILTPPKVTSSVIAEAASLGIKNVWMQPGSDSPEVVALARQNGMNVIAGGPCILVSGEEAMKAAAKL
ncbi:hypothetical protein SpCBS45565_g05807 [Spizellomyces sp. 'palustris']|nr:hypothetical protein SpCBS45565_g05807 [Spizellomyces sp. 'palustris']